MRHRRNSIPLSLSIQPLIIYTAIKLDSISQTPDALRDPILCPAASLLLLDGFVPLPHATLLNGILLLASGIDGFFLPIFDPRKRRARRCRVVSPRKPLRSPQPQPRARLVHPRSLGLGIYPRCLGSTRRPAASFKRRHGNPTVAVSSPTSSLLARAAWKHDVAFALWDHDSRGVLSCRI